MIVWYSRNAEHHLLDVIELLWIFRRWKLCVKSSNLQELEPTTLEGYAELAAPLKALGSPVTLGNAIWAAQAS